MSPLGLLLLTLAGSPPAPAWTPGLTAAAAGVNRFTFDLYARLRDQPGSRFASPWSVATAFAMLADGANGPTRDEVVRVLHLPADLPSVGDLGRHYAAGGKGYELSVANGLCGQTGYPWRPDLLARQRDRYGAALTGHNFMADPEGGRRAVNRWVEQQTRDRVKDLLPAKAVDPNTRLVLANAVYFKGRWADPFPPAATRPQPFTRADGTTTPVPLMYRSGGYRHGRFDGFAALDLPYAGGELAFTVLLPDKPDGLPAVEQRLSAEAVAGWTGKMQHETDVRVHLPRVKVDDRVEDLPSVLKVMGVRLAFEPRAADLLGLVTRLPPGDTNLYVSGAFHRAFVELTEEGTEAAAATAAVLAAGDLAQARPPEPVVFRADRPFLFLVRDVKHGTVLFVGRFAGP